MSKNPEYIQDGNKIKSQIKPVKLIEQLKSKSKDLIGAVVLFTLVLIFAPGIAKLLNATVVPYVFSQVSTHVITDIAIFILLLIAFMKWAEKILKAYVPSIKITLVFIGLSLLYGFRNHVFEQTWIFYTFQILPDVNYLSVVYLLLLGQFLFYVNLLTRFHKRLNGWIPKLKKESPRANAEKKLEMEPVGFYCDEPISEEKKDELGYTKYAERVSENLSKTNSNQSFAIGINGKWGSGKTSFMNLMKCAMKSDDFIKVDFKPWNSQTPQAIVQDFLDTLRGTLSPYHGDVGNELERYAEKLIDVDNSRISRGLKNVLKLSGDRGSTEYSQKIETSIREIGKKIVVFIDDTDRLNKNEIFEVLRLIRNTANFSNTFFVVAYDRNYLIKTITETPKPHLYLEKIFQVEISLPIFNQEFPEEYLLSQLKSMEAISNEDLKNFLKPNPYLVQILRYGLKSLRDVSRLLNSLKLNYLPIANQLMLKDSLFVEILRLKHPELVAQIASNQQKYFFPYGSAHSLEHHMVFLKSEQPKENEPVCKDYKKTALYKKFEDQFENLGFQNKNDYDQITEIIWRWFPRHIHNYYDSSRDHLSVINPTRFDLYFRFNLIDSDIDESAFRNARENGRAGMNKFLDKINHKNMLKSFVMRINIIQMYKNDADLLCILEAQVRAYELVKNMEENVNLKIKLSTSLYGNVISKLRDADGDLLSGLFENSKSNYKTFLKQFLKSKIGDGVNLNHKITRDIRKQNLEEFPLSHDELFELSCIQFSQLIQRKVKYSPDIWEVFTLLEYPYHKSIPKDQSDWLHYTEKGQKLITDVILKKFPREILLSAITVQPGAENIYGILSDLIYPFVTGENLLAEVEKVDHFDEKEEFLDFLRMLVEIDFKTELKYPFDKIKPGT